MPATNTGKATDRPRQGELKAIRNKRFFYLRDGHMAHVSLQI